jgi:hypothetical protein
MNVLPVCRLPPEGPPIASITAAFPIRTLPELGSTSIRAGVVGGIGWSELTE